MNETRIQGTAESVETLTGLDDPTKAKEGRHTLLTVTFGIGVLALWQLAAFVGLIHPIIVPGPLDIARAFPEVVSAEYFWPNVRITLFQIGVGFVVATFVALALALAVSRWERVRATIYPYVIAIQSVPKIVFTPIFITWFGFGPPSKIVNAVVIAFFPLFINALSGLMQIDQEARRLMRSLTASNRQIFFKLSLPDAMPMILTGLRLCWTNSVIGVIVAEFIGANEGLGYLITLFNFQLRIARVFVLIIVLSVFTVTVYKIIERIERRVCFWAYDVDS